MEARMYLIRQSTIHSICIPVDHNVHPNVDKLWHFNCWLPLNRQQEVIEQVINLRLLLAYILICDCTGHWRFNRHLSIGPEVLIEHNSIRLSRIQPIDIIDNDAA